VSEHREPDRDVGRDKDQTVVRQAASSVRIYRRAEIQTMSCTPYCESSYKSDAEKSSEAEMNASR